MGLEVWKTVRVTQQRQQFSIPETAYQTDCESDSMILCHRLHLYVEILSIDGVAAVLSLVEELAHGHYPV